MIVCIAMVVLTGCALSELNISDYEYQPKAKSQIYASDEKLITEVYNENRTYMPLEEIPQDLQKAIVAVEDSRFYSHHGFNLVRIIKSALVNLKEGQLEQGGSTITQQVAKNLFLTNEKTFTRKIKEVIYAVQLENKYNKGKILEIYLNEIYLGQGTYGVQEASKRFFGKDVGELSLAESALIAGLPQAPSAYDPSKHLDRAKDRQEIVLDQMVANEDITREQADQAKQEEIIIAQHTEDSFKDQYQEESKHFVSQVIHELVGYFSQNVENTDNLNEDEIYDLARYQLETGGYKIYTTLNTSMQKWAAAAVRNGIQANRLGKRGNGSLVSMDPNTGAVLAYYGGVRDIDMASKPRQPGSTIKPLYYAGTINEELINSNSLILDEPTTFQQEGVKEVYNPKNYGEKYMGYVTAREALVHSLNNASVKVMDYLGVETTIDYLESYGIDTLDQNDYQLATALGGMTRGISPLEMANAYSIFANNGIYQEAYFIERVEDARGNIIYSKDKQELERKKVLSDSTISQMEEMLTDVVSRGTAKGARLPYYTAGKTGTSNKNKDLWFVGFVKPLATSVWIGNEDNHSIQGGSGISASIYKNYMTNIIENQLIQTNELERVTTYDDTIEIAILLPDRDVGQIQEITEEDIADIVIPEDEISYFEDRMVERVAIDKKSGKRFIEGHCPEDNKRIKIYLQGHAPLEECDLAHIFDRFQNFYDNIKVPLT